MSSSHNLSYSQFFVHFLYNKLCLLFKIFQKIVNFFHNIFGAELSSYNIYTQCL